MGTLIYFILVPSLLGAAKASGRIEFFVKVIPQEVRDFKIESARLEGMRLIDVDGVKREQPLFDGAGMRATTRAAEERE